MTCLLVSSAQAQQLGRRTEAKPVQNPVLQVNLADAPPLVEPIVPLIDDLPGDDVPGECDLSPDHSFMFRAGGSGVSISERPPPSGGGVNPGGGNNAGAESDGGEPTNGRLDGGPTFTDPAFINGSQPSRKPILPANPEEASANPENSSTADSPFIPRAQAMGGGPITLNLSALGNTYGGKLKGIVNMGGSKTALEAYSDLGLRGGLARVFFYLHKDNSVDSAGKQIRDAQAKGMRVLLTASGTPWALRGEYSDDKKPGSIEPYARSVPIDKQAWAEELKNQLEILETRYGVLPEYVEIGNEPDRKESWEGSLEDYLELYEASSGALRARFAGIKVGGMGLAGATSPIDSSRESSALLALIERADENNLPLDFLSWHNYGLPSQMRYSGIIDQLRDSLNEVGRPNVELFVSEWNIRPNTEKDGLDFDAASSASNFIGFAAASADLGLDGSCFFMLHDQGIADLEGKAVGALTAHGVKKPVFRAMEFLYKSCDEASVPVQIPDNEYALGAVASLSGDRLRVLLSNDTVEPKWVFTNACREAGIKPAVAERHLDAGDLPYTPIPEIADLEALGMDAETAEKMVDILERTLAAYQASREPREVRIQLEGASVSNLDTVWRFDETHNAPLSHRDEIIPEMNTIENRAQSLAKQAVSENGGALTADGKIAQYKTKLREARLHIGIAEFDNHPLVGLASETAESAGIYSEGSELVATLEPDSAMVLEMQVLIEEEQEIRSGKDRGTGPGLDYKNPDWLLGLACAIVLLVLLVRINSRKGAQR
jgi:hypothetical protein